MVKSYLIQIFFLAVCFSWSHAQVADKVSGKVLDKSSGSAIKGESLYVSNSDTVTTNNKGEFTVKFPSPPELPLRVKILNDNFNVTGTSLDPDSQFLTVMVRLATDTVEGDKIKILELLDKDLKPMGKTTVTVNGITYTSNELGLIRLKDKTVTTKSQFEFKELAVISYEYVPHSFTYRLKLQKLLEARKAMMNNEMPFENSFKFVLHELEKRKKYVDSADSIVRTGIADINEKLLKHPDIKEKYKDELRNNFELLQAEISKQKEAFMEEERKTEELLINLRDAIYEKDSVIRAAQKQIIIAEKERKDQEQVYQGRMSILILIVIMISFFLVALYMLLKKIKKQNQRITAANKELLESQSLLTKTLDDVNYHRSQLEDQNKNLELFVNKASHDLKGPLRSVLGLTQIGSMESNENSTKSYFKLIQESVTRLDNLLNDMLKLSRTKQMKVETEVLDLNGMITEIIESFKHFPGFNRIKKEVEIDESLKFRSDKKLIYSVFQNFIENSLKYYDPTKAENYLKVEAFVRDNKVVFRFVDNGFGIDQKHLPHIFDMFYKINPDSKGTGLGLHIVKVTVEKLGGEVHVESKLREGTTFEATFSI